jgi:CRP/FNR family cyclic AMP-dependent transcriptional regulator
MEEIKNHVFPRGKVIIRQGSAGTSAFIIVKGSVEVYREDAMGKKEVLAVLKEQEIFGEMALIESKPRSASVVALEDVECTVLTRDMFKKLPPNNPGVVAVKKIMEQRLKRR